MTDARAILDAFRAASATALRGALALANNPPGERALVAWSFGPVRWTPPRGAAPEDERDRWDWLWTGTVYDPREMERRAGLERMTWERVFEPLRAARLAFPDGTLADHAERMLKSSVARALTGRKSAPK